MEMRRLVMGDRCMGFVPPGGGSTVSVELEGAATAVCSEFIPGCQCRDRRLTRDPAKRASDSAVKPAGTVGPGLLQAGTEVMVMMGKVGRQVEDSPRGAAFRTGVVLGG